jgi:hypothetical protein
METTQTEQKQIWQAPEIKVIDLSQITLAFPGGAGDGVAQTAASS